MATGNKIISLISIKVKICYYVVPVAMDSDAKAPHMIKAVLFRNFMNIIGAKSDAASLIDP